MLHLARITGTILLAAFLAGKAEAQTPFAPVAVVNDSAITGFDLAQRAQIMAVLGFPSDNADALRSAALDQLVNDRLKLQAGRQIGLEPTPELIEQGISEFSRRTELSNDAFRDLMRARGVSDQALDDLVAAEIIWVQVVRARFVGRSEPGEAEINAELELLEQRRTLSFNILEIGLPLADGARTAEETRALAEELSRALNDGGDFTEAVSRYSRAPSAARGGAVGWVDTSRMPPDLVRELSRLQPGQVTRPLPVSGGISILKLVDRRETAGGQLDDDIELRERIREELSNEQTDRLADGLLQEMRRDALIEIR